MVIKALLIIILMSPEGVSVATQPMPSMGLCEATKRTVIEEMARVDYAEDIRVAVACTKNGVTVR